MMKKTSMKNVVDDEKHDEDSPCESPDGESNLSDSEDDGPLGISLKDSKKKAEDLLHQQKHAQSLLSKKKKEERKKWEHRNIEQQRKKRKQKQKKSTTKKATLTHRKNSESCEKTIDLDSLINKDQKNDQTVIKTVKDVEKSIIPAKLDANVLDHASEFTASNNLVPAESESDTASEIDEEPSRKKKKTELVESDSFPERLSFDEIGDSSQDYSNKGKIQVQRIESVSSKKLAEKAKEFLHQHFFGSRIRRQPLQTFKEIDVDARKDKCKELGKPPDSRKKKIFKRKRL